MTKVGIPKITDLFPVLFRMYLVASDRKPNNGKKLWIYLFFHLSGSPALTMSRQVSAFFVAVFYFVFPRPITKLSRLSALGILLTFRSGRRGVSDIIDTQSFGQEKDSFPGIVRTFPHIFHCLEPSNMTILGSFSSFHRGDRWGRIPAGVCAGLANW